jgi:hypothetical protein
MDIINGNQYTDMTMKTVVSIMLLAVFNVVYCQTNPCDEFNDVNTKVRDGLISKDVAIERIKELVPKIKAYFSESGGVESTEDEWVFPLEGYTASSIGGKNGSGYKPKGYDYFDGNNHGGHPAHDIFIMDKDQDDLDDYTVQPVNILSVTNGVVIACEPDWEAGSDLRGGKYIYVYDPLSEGFFYYAHNRNIFVKPGDLVKAGQIIAECGRTGLNAYKRRSPTHLHLMFLKVEDGYPKPEDIYRKLLKSSSK